MAYYTRQQVDTYFNEKFYTQLWSSEFKTTTREAVIERVSTRLDALPWPAEFGTQEKRAADPRVEGAFYDLCRHYLSVADEKQYVGDRGERVSLPDRIPLAFLDLPLTCLTRLITIFPELSEIQTARKYAAPIKFPPSN